MDDATHIVHSYSPDTADRDSSPSDETTALDAQNAVELNASGDADSGTTNDIQPSNEIEPTNLRMVRRAHSDETPADPHQIIEALLFASDAPLSAARLAELVGAGGVTEVRLCIAELNDRYTAAGMSFRIESIARGYQMLTLAAFQPWLAKLFKKSSETRLSASALETLSIIAYKQPLIRTDIESIRGVACGDVINRLRDMGLVRTAGRAEVVGRPLLYATTRKFLDVFGLADLNDLPALETLKFRPAPAIAPAPAAEVANATTPEAQPELRAVAGA